MSTFTLPMDYRKMSSQYRRLVRNEYVRIQENKCWLCHAPLDGPPVSTIQDYKLNEKLFPPGFLNNPVHLHHDHPTGMTIGAVHAKCNGFLWQQFRE